MLSGKVICGDCGSHDVRTKFHYQTSQNGQRRLCMCRACGATFSETKYSPIAGLQKPISLVAQVLRTRLGGMGFNEAARAFAVARGTLREWERKFAALMQPLLLYALAHKFLSQVVEGDELYTKVGQNHPPEDSLGWTVVLMERASRFIWLQECGRRDRQLFKKAIKRLAKLIEQTKDLTLVTDGERRYGNILFEICSELVKTGKPGRPKKRSERASRCGSRTRAARPRSEEGSVRSTKPRSPSTRRPSRTSPTRTSKQTASKAKTPPSGGATQHIGGVPTPTPKILPVSSEHST